jgi:hypothetical protein
VYAILFPGLAADHEAMDEWMLITAIVYNNFEISDLDFWRGEAYTAYFNHLDRSGGFYYEVRPPITVT